MVWWLSWRWHRRNWRGLPISSQNFTNIYHDEYVPHNFDFGIRLRTNLVEVGLPAIDHLEEVVVILVCGWCTPQQYLNWGSDWGFAAMQTEEPGIAVLCRPIGVHCHPTVVALLGSLVRLTATPPHSRLRCLIRLEINREEPKPFSLTLSM